MKRIFLLIFFITIQHMAGAQIEKGTLAIGAGIIGNPIANAPFGNGISLTAQKDNFKLYLKPLVGIFILKNLEIGSGFSFGRVNTTASTNDPFFSNYPIGNSNSVSYFESDQVKATYYGASPFIKLFLGSSKLKPFFIAGWDYLHEKSFLEITTQLMYFQNGYGGPTIIGNQKHRQDENDYTNLFFGSGINYFISNRIALEGLAQYNYNLDKKFLIQNSFSFSLGVQLYFKRVAVD